jgi:hypothetical protein
MPRRARTSVDQVSTVLSAILKRDHAAAAGRNGVLSRAEDVNAPKYLRAAADQVRALRPRARVTVDAVEPELLSRARALIAQVNRTGAETLSKAEATAAFKRDPIFGEAVLHAYEVASGNGLDVDSLAQTHVTWNRDLPLKVFRTEAEAMAHQEPDGAEFAWLVRLEDGLLKNRYVSGRNDLWAQRFEIDRLTGVVTVTAEH